MSQSSIFGTCDSCGKKYRVPSADRTYPCKACGGNVHVAELVDATTARDRYVSVRRPDRNSIPLLPIVLVLLAVTGIGLGGFQMGLFGEVLGTDVDPRLRELDISKANAALALGFKDGDVDGLSLMHHPEGRESFERRLEWMQEHRGWDGAWPTVVAQTAELEGGSAQAPEKGISTGGNGNFFLRAQWQYDDNVERWFIYDLWVTPSALDARTEEFRQAWDASDSAKLRPFFAAASADKMEQVFTKQLTKAGWKGAHPELGKGVITGVEQALTPAGEHLGVKVESTFPTGDQEVTIRWRFHQKTDRWIISGLQI
jgi:hypothetical protein